MRVIFVTPEAVPFAKTGGLADVAGALPIRLNQIGVDTQVFMPLYQMVKKNGSNPRLVRSGLKVRMGSKDEGFSLLSLRHKNTDFYFIKKDEFFDRDGLYGTEKGDYPDNAQRFGFFAKAVLASINYLGKADILHCNDWQSALLPLYIRLFYKGDPLFRNSRVIFTIHNMAYQGLFDKGVMYSTDIPEEFFNPQALEFYGKLNLMKAGILYSDAITTVSEGYSREILTPEYGCGLDGVLRTRSKDLYGIINGADYSAWNPKTDRFIKANYNKTNLNGKVKCKKDLLKQFGLKFDKEKPLAAMITRLARQKGIDIVADAMDRMLQLGVNFLLLGTGDEEYNRLFMKLACKYKEKIGVKIAFDNALAHKIEAGADMFLMPSRYEPCGLNQMYSLKYGTVPIVRATGGLDDTIEDFNPQTKKGNGFKFNDATPGQFLEAVRKAVCVFKDKRLWALLQNNCFKCDFSQRLQAREYKRLYEKILAR